MFKKEFWRDSRLRLPSRHRGNQNGQNAPTNVSDYISTVSTIVSHSCLMPMWYEYRPAALGYIARGGIVRNAQADSATSSLGPYQSSERTLGGRHVMTLYRRGSSMKDGALSLALPRKHAIEQRRTSDLSDHLGLPERAEPYCASAHDVVPPSRPKLLFLKSNQNLTTSHRVQIHHPAVSLHP